MFYHKFKFLQSNNYDFVPLPLPSRYRYNVTVTERQPPLSTVTDRYGPFPMVTERYMRYRTLQALPSVTERYRISNSVRKASKNTSMEIRVRKYMRVQAKSIVLNKQLIWQTSSCLSYDSNFFTRFSSIADSFQSYKKT
jgi:hypothetical protein